MSSSLLEKLDTPTENDRHLAQETSRRLASHLQKCPDYLQFQIVEEDARPGEVLTVPAPAIRLLFDILTEIANGNVVTLTPIYAELTTQQAADFLNVSRPFLIGLLEKGEIPFRMVGTHRRILFQDLVKYKMEIDAARLETLRELAAQAQELGMGY